jgi:hypothetical protein
MCLLCGRPVGAAEVELERLDSPPAAAVRTEPVVVERRGPRRSKRSLLSVVVGAVAVAIAIGVLSDGGGGSPEPERATPASEPAPESSEVDPGPDDQREQGQLPSTSVAQLGPAATPLLGRTTGGLSVYAVTGRSIARVELDTGVLTIASLAIPRIGGQTTALAVHDGRLYVGRDLELLVAPLDLAHPAEGAYSNVALLLGDRDVVVREIDPRTGATAVRRFSAAGRLLQEWPTAGDQGQWTPGVFGDRLLVVNGGRIYTVGVDGVSQYTIGDYVASNPHWVLWRGCDEAMVCRYHLGDPADPYRRSTSLQPSQVDASRWGPLLAPDGASMVVADRSGTPILMRTEDGDYLARLDFNTRPTWSPDGEWIFTRSGGSTIVAISTRDGYQWSFTLRGLFGTQNMWLAVG